MCLTWDHYISSIMMIDLYMDLGQKVSNDDIVSFL